MRLPKKTAYYLFNAIRRQYHWLYTRLILLETLELALGVAVFNEAKPFRKTAIEPVFDLLRNPLLTTGHREPFPVRGLASVSTF